jgi:hypothetical protein
MLNRIRFLGPEKEVPRPGRSCSGRAGQSYETGPVTLGTSFLRQPAFQNPRPRRRLDPFVGKSHFGLILSSFEPNKRRRRLDPFVGKSFF